jgi:hypothetical protein
MRKYTKGLNILLGVILLFGQSIIAQRISEDEAKTTALYWMQNMGLKDVKIHSLEEFLKEDIVSLYVIDVEPLGFIVLSADRNVEPVLAFSTESNATIETFNPSAIKWIRAYGDFVFDQIKNHIYDPHAQLIWQQLLQKQYSFKGKSVNPLVMTKWDQGVFYNTDCPVDYAGPDGHALTGCVATAMAQVMKYHNFPEHGTGEHSYVHPVYGTLSANFGETTYGWNNMPNSCYNYNDDVAQLMSHCGIGTNMNYGPSGSGTSMEYSTYALKNFFNYHYSAQLRHKDNVSNDTWIEMLKEELDNSRPVLYAGFSGYGGHAFVCDGYNNSNLFHFNWGWGGSSDGYFSVTDVNGFNSNQQIVTPLFPGSESGPHLIIKSTLSNLTPNPVVNGQSMALPLQIINVGTDWEGCVVLTLCEPDGTEVAELDEKFLLMQPGVQKTAIFHVDEINYPEGDYLLYVKYKTNCSETAMLVDPGEFVNPYAMHIINAGVDYAPVLSSPVSGQPNVEYEGMMVKTNNWKKADFQIIYTDFNGDEPTAKKLLLSEDNGSSYETYIMNQNNSTIATGRRYYKRIDFGGDPATYAGKKYKFHFEDNEFPATGEQDIEYCIPFLTDNQSPNSIDLGETANLKIKYHHEDGAFPEIALVWVKSPTGNWQSYSMNEGNGNIEEGKEFENLLTANETGVWQYKFDFMGGKTLALGSGKIYTFSVLPNGVSENSTPDLHVYPNPVQNILYVETEVSWIYEIYNSIGEKILHNQLINNNFIDMSSLSKGVYFIRFSSAGKTICQKIVK